MEARPGDKGPQGGEARQDEDTRWLNVLEEVAQEHETGRPWWYRVGLFLAWAAGFALAAALAATLVLALVELFRRGRQFTGTTLSDYVFWASALLMIGGFLTPSSKGLARVKGRKAVGEESRDERRARALRRRIGRVYDPWRWRIWAGAILSFGIAVLVGMVSAR